ncbi:MAG: hypothetical protein HYY40_03145 [Bacteroidetes bacterium]|nr:hypothetical protein [Bacteroidota bacterium]
MKTQEICYKCGGAATTREHIPPICLFPEKKDIGVNDFRNNLITVPSCSEHNIKKSKDDEFLFTCLAGVVGNNLLGYFHTRTKVKRALVRKGKDSIYTIFKDPEHKYFKTKGGKIYPVIQGSPHIDRLIKCFQHIACGLYFSEYKKVFKGECIILMGFLKYKDENFDKIKIWCKRAFELQSENWKIKGTNPEIFKYQFGVADNNGLVPLKMTFYEGTDVFASFKDENAKEPFDLATKLIQSGIKTIVKLGDEETIEFN